MITMIIVGGACALVGGFVGGLIISAPSEPTIKPISPDWGLLNEKQHLEYRLAVTEKENIRLREENYRFRMMTHAWNHCCPHCYTQHTRVVYAKSPKEQEIVDLLKKTSVPLDELKEKFGIK
jgi:hypothetical protein